MTANLEFKEAEGGGTAVHWTGDLVAVTGLAEDGAEGADRGRREEGDRGRVGRGGGTKLTAGGVSREWPDA